MAPRIRNTSKLILVRHGQSTYNLENKFTGWKNVPLTEKGRVEAHQAGKLLSKVKLNYAFTSKLKRAQSTLNIILQYNSSKLKVLEHISLNERDYGDLIGQNKLKAAKIFGEDQVQLWRRSYDVPPPGGESLKMTCERTIPYFKDKIQSKLKASKIVLVSAHGNSIRAIIMHLFNFNKNEILKTEIGWCEPWIITFEKYKIIKFEILKRPNCDSMSFYPRYPIFNKEIV